MGQYPNYSVTQLLSYYRIPPRGLASDMPAIMPMMKNVRAKITRVDKSTTISHTPFRYSG